jgi:CRISPR-associated exonuclease Cas4
VIKVSGTMYSYSFLCNRKLWFFVHGIKMEQESENVKLGKVIDETSFCREEKGILIDNTVSIDFIRKGLVFEVKKSDKELQMAINQLKYYLYILKQKGLECPKGIISIPAQKKTIDVTLQEDDISKIEIRLRNIESIIKQDIPPSVISKKCCKPCAYFEICYI